MKETRPLRLKISGIVILVAVFTLLLAFVYSYFYKSKIIKKAYKDEVAMLSSELKASFDKKYDIGITNATGFSDNKLILGFVNNGLKDGLVEPLSTVSGKYNKFTNFKGVRIQITDTENRLFIKSWNPYYERQKPYTEPHYNLTVKQQKPFVGLVLNEDGLNIRAAVPLIDEGTVLGTLEFLQGVGSISRDFQKKDKLFVQVFSENGLRQYEKGRNNKKAGKYHVTNSKWFADKLLKDLSSVDMDALIKKGSMETKKYFLMSTPVKDLNGVVVAYNILGTPTEKFRANINNVASIINTFMIIIAAAMLIMIIVLLFILKYVVSKPLEIMKNLAKDLAEGDGDLTKRLEIKSKDELESVSYYIDMFIDKTSGVVRTAIDNSNETAAAGEELSSTSVSLLENIQEQRRMVSESEGLVSDVAENLDKTEEYAVTTTEVLEETRETLQDMINSLSGVAEKINEDSRKQKMISDNMELLTENTEEIRNILHIIGDVADQTNLLALNASIEAARAGEHGRGFAVVADEVRKLAEKTQASLDDINKTINDIVSNVGNMSGQIEEISESIVETADEANILMDRTGASSEKIAEAVGVSSEVVSMSTIIATKTKSLIEITNKIVEVAQHNEMAGKSVEEVSVTLSKKSHELFALLNKFKV